MNRWIGVDLDGTLAYYDGWKGEEHIGKAITRMVKFVEELIENGQTVKIFTSRVCHDAEKSRPIIKAWLEEAGLPDLEITNVKDYGMTCLYDDRCHRVVANTGIIQG